VALSHVGSLGSRVWVTASGSFQGQRLAAPSGCGVAPGLSRALSLPDLARPTLHSRKLRPVTVCEDTFRGRVIQHIGMQDEIHALLLAFAEAGATVVRLKVRQVAGGVAGSCPAAPQDGWVHVIEH
jgi:hypothetical protein